MATITHHKKRSASSARPARPKAKSKKNQVRSGTAIASRLREKLGLTQQEFAPMFPVSVRTLATLEQGMPPSEPIARRLTELDRLSNALAEVIRDSAIGDWLKKPNAAFGGLKPLEVIDRGESDRLWEMTYFLRSGVTS